MAGNPATRGLTIGLLLTAPAAAAGASVSVIASDGTVTSPASLQDVTVGARFARTQFQYTLQDANLDELNEWAPKVLAKARNSRRSMLPVRASSAIFSMAAGTRPPLFL